jgi:thiaminase/transcriptional activator TenA
MSSSGSCDPPSQACPPLSRRLWSRYEPVAVCILHHPFVSGLGTGRLEQSTFKSYVGQDAFFLRSFAKAYAYALTKSDSQEHIENFR